MHPRVKICGIKSKEEIAIINDFPVEYIGFIFAESKRKVLPEDAAQLKASLRKDIQVVGVFVNESVDKVNEIIDQCGLDVVQLHGEESPEYCKQIHQKVWKSIPVKNAQSLKKINDYQQVVDGILLETYSKDQKGGTGKAFDWDLVKNLQDSLPLKDFILAGGLNPNNIKRAIDTLQPTIIDLNSGLETDGYKDRNKITQLFNRLKEVNYGDE